jgi:hypothetical protein
MSTPSGASTARDRAGRDARHGLAGAGATAAGDGADPELRLVRVVGVRRPVRARDLGVVLAPLIGVADLHRDRRAQREAIEDSRQDLDAVGLLALGDDVALAGAAPVELALDLGGIDGDARRTAVDGDAHGRAVRLTEGGHTKRGAEAVARHQ